MSATEQPQAPATQPAAEINLTTPSDRRVDVESKHGKVVEILKEIGCDGLLVLLPANFSWVTSGGVSRGIVNEEDLPAIYFSAEGRWLICSNVDTQRLFDEEIDGLGFQLKEWPWHWGRSQLLADLCQGRKVACDKQLLSCESAAEVLKKYRRVTSDYDQACYRALGQILSHAIEATCRTMNPGETEREIAGQVSHRLLHRGVQPISISVFADGRSMLYRRGGFTSTPVRSSCLVTVTARKYGLCATATRSVCFGEPENNLRREHDAACRVSATYIAGSWPDSLPGQILGTGRRVYQVCQIEHEWLTSPQGHVTGRCPVEIPITPNTEELFQAGWVVTWNATAGSAVSCDTLLVTEDGPRTLTRTENWPLKSIRIQGAEFVRPDLLIR